MNLPKNILIEWRYRHKHGNPNKNNPEDIALLNEILLENEMPLISEDVPVEPQEITESDIQKLKRSIELVKDKYARYLSVFYYFDANSLGTISEILLTKLLNSETDIEAQHTGASGGLADLVVNGIPISLKTTSAKEYINLGEDTLRIPAGESEKVAQSIIKMLKIENPNEKELDSNTKIKDVLSDKSRFPAEIKKSISDRIDAIVAKLAGDDEKFVWVEKVYRPDRVLKQLNIHICDYNASVVKEIFLNSYLYITPKGWGMKNEKKQVLIRSHSKLEMSLAPLFVRETVDRETIQIALPIKDFKDLAQTRTMITDKLFASLDTIYDSLT